MNKLRNGALLILFVLFVVPSAMVSCGGELMGASPGSNVPGGGEPQFEIVSSWRPSLAPMENETRIEYSLIIANRGSAAGKVSCGIWMNGERLPGNSTTVAIDPGEEDTVEGDARTEVKPDDVNLVDLTPRCE